ncbi:SET and MYND domain-containing protein 4-like [Bradysia coprophila]|uniref:SET and MYND domain-containing protein 4-like n=1 Tax=Bradysia coprophila TaxID=38358 RepID=UPI00187DA931|nr:SET and MYND domain-containing protein 4-like [Bradysia coprophila]
MDIYAVNDELIATLTKSEKIVPISKAFKLCETNADKVKFVEDLLVEYDRIPKCDLRNAKNNNRSKELRQKGNELFAQRKTFEALELYNHSICLADTKENCEELAIGYANRSAVYFKWKMYEQCGQNIELAKKAGYPKRLMDKLLKRETDCLEHINNEFKPAQNNYVPQLQIEANPQIPFIANCLEMQESQEEGRYITTNIELSPGEVVAIEEPYAVYLQNTSRYHRCTNCLAENNLNLIPCPLCTNAMFCSEGCLKQAYEEHHQFECPIIDCLATLFNKIHMTALRVTLKALQSFESIDEMMQFCRENESSNATTFSLDHTRNLSALERYKPIHCLATNEEKRKASDLFQRATIAAVLKNQLLKHTKLKDILTTDDSQSAFVEILYRHLQTAPTNFHTLDLAETPSMAGIEYANGAYPFCSLLNHSCAPNICRMSIGRKMMVFALRVIQRGEQLFDNYGYHHCMMTKENRQESLMFQYNFTCNCCACRNDYGTIIELPMAPNMPDIHSDRDIEKLTLLDEEFASNNLKRYCQYLKNFDSHYPCRQIAEAQENLKMCLHILVANYSLKAKPERF